MNIRALLSERFHQAMIKAGIDESLSPHLAPSKNTKFGDYQANGAMAAAKALKTNPREVAQRILDCAEIDDLAEKIEIAGPGFINIHLNKTWLAKQLKMFHRSPEAQLQTDAPQTVVIDYSSPNLAKQMHVGHLRSTIIGDAIARILELQGHTVIRQNHVGDWGTQFGMLIAELENQMSTGESAQLALQDLEVFYQQAKQHFDESEEFANTAREYVVKLQSGDEKILALWEQFKTISLQHSQEIYEQLNVTLRAEDVRGESAYNDDLQPIVDELKNQGFAVEDDGATIAFLEELADKEGKPSPMIIQKQGGGFLYATTDLATLRYRAHTLNADRALYFIDARQSLHMKQVFTLGRKAGYASDHISLEHHAFGTMMGSDGKPFKTRTGGTVKLKDLLDEALERAEVLIAEKNPDLSQEEQNTIAKAVGIGAVKYADLAKTRTNDYLFNWDTMLSFEGNTAPYLQYAYTRIQSIFRKGGIDSKHFDANIVIEKDIEKSLAIKLLQLPEVIENVATDAYPHLLCNYLYDLASLFMSFYEQCPILKDGVSEEEKNSRLMLADSTAKVLKLGLNGLGIETLEKM